jgi:hypothetical protein
MNTDYGHLGKQSVEDHSAEKISQFSEMQQLCLAASGKTAGLFIFDAENHQGLSGSSLATTLSALCAHPLPL